MKISSLRSLANLASLRFSLIPSASTVIDRRYMASRAVGDKWAGHGGPALPLLREMPPRSPRLRVSLHPTFNTQNPKFKILFAPLCVLSVFAVTPFAAAATTWSNTWTVTTAIPDNDDAGYINTRNVSAIDLTEVQNVTVNLNFTGGWNGDLYAYLVHGDTGFAVLLNRPGRTAIETDGSATVGLAITLDDSAFADIHTAIPLSGGSVSGTYQPDGRNTDPHDVLNTDARTAMLSSFNGLDGNGSWTLFVADQSAGETSTLQSWSLTITGVPEPGTTLLAALGLTTLLHRRREIPKS